MKFPTSAMWMELGKVSIQIRFVYICLSYVFSIAVCTLDPDVNCDGSTECCLICSTPDSSNTFDFPPFTPHCSQGSLSAKTFSMSAVHAGGVKEYNAHNLYGFMEAIATQVALEAVTNKRSFILTRSTFAGSGMYAAHWTGDNSATWNDLSASIVTMNNMALFGIPMVGADICGFLGDTTAELCSRWIQVGAFSPFSRNHNGLYDAPQELYRWDSVAEASRTVLDLRYRLLPYLYTLLYNAHSKGETVLNAMWMHFPSDRTAFFRDGQYMWSDGILFTPVLVEGGTEVEGYFPRGKWYSLFDDSLVDASTQGVLKILDTPLLSTNVHARGGTVIPMQQFKMTTTEAKTTPFTLTVALDTEGSAAGSLYMDDGEQITLSDYSEVEWLVTTTSGMITLTSTVLSDLYSCTTCTLGSVQVLGVAGDSCVASLEVNGEIWNPSSTILSQASTASSYTSVTVSFDDPPNIISSHVFQISCSSSDSSSDNNGFSSLPSYAQGLIITTCIIFGLAILFVISKVSNFNNTLDDEGYSSHHSLKDNLSMKEAQSPLLDLDEENSSN